MLKVDTGKARMFANKIRNEIEKRIIENGAELFADDGTPAPVNTQEEAILKSESKGKKNLILINPHSPGDIVMMTAAIRDLHATYPGEYKTGVDTPCPEIFEGNPYITELDAKDKDTVKIRTHYPIIHDSNEGSYHFIHGYRKHLEECIGRPIKQGKMKGDLHIRDEEKGWVSAVEEVTKDKRPFWIIDAGYKADFTAKAWSFRRYQDVVDYFKDKIQFVQIGHNDHYHPELKNVVNMVGETDLRQLIRLVYHSIGVLTPVSLPMVLAAAVPTSFTFPKNRGCVVLSGGREPVQWQMHPNHQFIHVCGTMPCCDLGGCWMSRVIPLGDGDEKDKNNLCLAPVKVDGQNIAQCMANISTEDVIRGIERYYAGGVFKHDGRQTIGTKYKNRDGTKPTAYDEDQSRKDIKEKKDDAPGDKRDLVAETIAARNKDNEKADIDPASDTSDYLDKDALRKAQSKKRH